MPSPSTISRKSGRRVPALAADKNDGRLVNTVEGLPSNGPIRVSFTTGADTSPASGLAVDRFRVANSVAFVKSERTFGVPPKEARKLGKFAIVRHNVDPNGNGE